MSTIRFYLDKRSTAADGKKPILVTISHNKTVAFVSTGIRVKPENWNGNAVIGLRDSVLLNAQLTRVRAGIEHAFAMQMQYTCIKQLTATEIKRAYLGETNKNSQSKLLKTIYFEYTTNGNLKPKTLETYENSFKKIEKFAGENVKIDEINLKWLRSFDAFLSKSLSINGKSVYLRCLRAVCIYARNNEIIDKNPFDNFKIKQEETKKRCVSVANLQKFYKYPVQNRIEMYRDYFFLIFFLIGINTKDLLLAKKSQVVNGRLEYIREKTGKKYSVKIEPEARALLNKYEGKGEYLLDALDHCKHYKSFARQINEKIRLIGKEVLEERQSDLFSTDVVRKVEPVIPNVTTYYARHSWATIAYECGISMDVISQALGHSFGNRTTMIYVKPDQNKVDEANRIVIDKLLAN